MISTVTSLIYYGFIAIIALFLFAVGWVIWVLATWETRIFKNETKKIVRNAEVYANKPVYTKKVVCKSEKQFQASDAEKDLYFF